jgi:hypothetical protein
MLYARLGQASSGCITLVDGSGWQLCGLFADPKTLTPGAVVSAGFDLSISGGGAYDEVLSGEVLDEYGNVVALFPAQEFATGVVDQNGVLQYPPPSSPNAVVTPLPAPSNTNVFFQADRPLPSSIQAGQAIFLVFGQASLFAGDQVGQQSGAWSFIGQLVLGAQATVEPSQGTVTPQPPSSTPPSGTPPPPSTPPSAPPSSGTGAKTGGTQAKAPATNSLSAWWNELTTTEKVGVGLGAAAVLTGAVLLAQQAA